MRIALLIGNGSRVPAIPECVEGVLQLKYCVGNGRRITKTLR